MTRCFAAWLAVPDPAHPWPSGKFEPCHTEATEGRFLRLGPNNVVIRFSLCAPHAQLFDEVVGHRQRDVVVVDE